MRGFRIGLVARLATSAVGVAGVLGAGLTPAQAYELYNPSQGFDHNTVTYFIDVTSPRQIPSWDVAHVNDAADAWTARPSTNLFYEEGGTSTSTADVQVYSYSYPDGFGGHGGCVSLFTAANGNSYCVSRGGQGYAEINFYPGQGSADTTPVYDQYSAGHEEGHAIGLAHSCTSPSIMQGPNSSACPGMPYGCPSETSCTSTPQTDDDSGVIALYGAFQSPGVGGGGPICLPGPGGLSKPDAIAIVDAAIQQEGPANIQLNFLRCVD